MFQNMTPGELLVLAFGGILALCTIVTMVGGAWEKIAKVVRVARAPELQQDTEIEQLKERLAKLERKLGSDEAQIADAKECNRVLTFGMLALLEHGINGNNIDQMQKAKAGVQDYLISH